MNIWGAQFVAGGDDEVFAQEIKNVFDNFDSRNAN